MSENLSKAPKTEAERNRPFPHETFAEYTDRLNADAGRQVDFVLPEEPGELDIEMGLEDYLEHLLQDETMSAFFDAHTSAEKRDKMITMLTLGIQQKGKMQELAEKGLRRLAGLALDHARGANDTAFTESEVTSGISHAARSIIEALDQYEQGKQDKETAGVLVETLASHLRAISNAPAIEFTN